LISKKSSTLKPLGQMNQKEKIKMWTVNRRRMPSDGKSSHCLWQGELIKSFKYFLKRYSFSILLWSLVFSPFYTIKFWNY
jgi:hypothetical protein